MKHLTNDFQHVTVNGVETTIKQNSGAQLKVGVLRENGQENRV